MVRRLACPLRPALPALLAGAGVLLGALPVLAEPQRPLRATPRAALYFWPDMGAVTRLTPWRRFNPPIEPVDTRTFEAEGEVVVIADIETPATTAVCYAQDQSLWGCGIMARAALFNRIRKGVLECRPAEQADANGRPRPLGWRCRHDGEDVARWMISAGWARPLPGTQLDYGVAALEARAARRGLWNGDWAIARQHLPLPPAQDIAPPEPVAAQAKRPRR